MNGYLVFDIETIVDEELADLVPPPDPAQPDKMPPLAALRPVCIGALWLRADFTVERLGLMGRGHNERSMIESLSAFMGKHRPTLVSWNGRGFDLPVLTIRAMRLGIAMPWAFGRDTRYRYQEDGHCDLMDQLSDYGAARRTSLNAIARAVGLPGKLGVDGGDVAALYAAGKLDEIGAYCLCDVVQTAFVFLRWRLLQGKLTAAEHERASAHLAEVCAADERVAAVVAGVARAEKGAA